MDEEIVFIHLTILFVIVGLFLALCKMKDYWRDRFGTDPIQPDLKYSDIAHHKTSLRWEK